MRQLTSKTFVTLTLTRRPKVNSLVSLWLHHGGMYNICALLTHLLIEMLVCLLFLGLFCTITFVS